jgi:hypothetical protein
MRLLGYFCPKISAACPKCKINVFGEGYNWFRNWMRFINYFNPMIFGNKLKCYYCGSSTRIFFSRGEYWAELSDE